MVEELLKFIRQTAVTAGNLAIEKWRSPLVVSEKSYQNLVTDADFAVQSQITNQIRSTYPAHGFLTEEEDASLPERGEIIWIIDPIDGTTNYSRFQPMFCVSIAAARPAFSSKNEFRQLEILAGAIYDPSRDELFSAGKTLGAWVNGRALSVSKTNHLEQTVLGVDWSTNIATKQSIRDVIIPLSRRLQATRTLGTSALSLAWVAAGRYDAYINYSMKAWDVAAGYLLITEANGRFSNAQGNDLDWNASGLDCVASNGHIHQDLISAIQK